MPDPRRERLARNEASFRELNESIETSVHLKLGGPRSSLAGFVCECGNVDCAEVVRLDLARYGKIRRDPCLFLVSPGHEITDVEDVVQREEGYLVVRKHDDVADIVRETDPRSS